MKSVIMARSLDDKFEAVLIFGEAGRNYHLAVRMFNDRFPENPISRSYLRKLLNKLQATGTLKDAPRSGRPPLSEEKKVEIVAEMVINPTQSTSAVAESCGVSSKSVQRVLKKEKFHPYKMKILHALTEDDPDRRVEFCEWLTRTIEGERGFLKRVCFADECTFFLNGKVNKQNVRYWSDTNPHIFREGHTQFPKKVNVWAGILGNRVVGPIFIRGNLTGVLYRNLLETEIEPRIRQIVLNNQEEFENREIIFQQDGAPPHFDRMAREFLDTNFPGRWIGRRGSTEWPPRSPDLTPLDFFLWGYLKSKIYATECQTIEELERRIIDTCEEIDEQTFINVREAIYNRALYCQDLGGGHIEHLMK